MSTSEIRTKDGTLYRNINGAWGIFRPGRQLLAGIVPDGTHTDHVTGHTTTVVGSSLTVVDRDGNESTVMQ